MQTRFSMRSVLLPLAAAATLATASTPTLASSSYYLKLDGISGESTSATHKNWSDIESFSWGVTATSSGPGGSAGKPQFSDFMWTQQLDSSITGLLNNISLGKHIKSAVVDFSTSAGGSKEQTYFKMSFDDILLSSVELAGSNGALPTVSSAFNYKKVTFDYWLLKPDGTLGAHSTATYDLSKNTGSVSALSLLFARGLAGPQVAPVPEPESWALLLAGLGLMGTVARRRLRKPA